MTSELSNGGNIAVEESISCSRRVSRQQLPRDKGLYDSYVWLASGHTMGRASRVINGAAQEMTRPGAKTEPACR